MLRKHREFRGGSFFVSFYFFFLKNSVFGAIRIKEKFPIAFQYVSINEHHYCFHHYSLTSKQENSTVRFARRIKNVYCLIMPTSRVPIVMMQYSNRQNIDTTNRISNYNRDLMTFSKFDITPADVNYWTITPSVIIFVCTYIRTWVYYIIIGIPMYYVYLIHAISQLISKCQ